MLENISHNIISDFLFGKGKDIIGKAFPKDVKEAVYNAYLRALEDWSSNDGARSRMKGRYVEMQCALYDKLKGDTNALCECDNDLLECWIKHLQADESTKLFINELEFKILKDNDEEIKRVIQNVRDILKSTIDISLIEHDLVNTSIAEVQDYIPRQVRVVNNPANSLSTVNLADYIIDSYNLNKGNHYILFSSAQTGKTIEIKHLAWQFNSLGICCPIIIEAKCNPDFKSSYLPKKEIHNGLPVALLVDALDEANDFNRFVVQLQHYAQDHPSVIIVATCRTNYKIQIEQSEFQELILEELSWKDAKEYIEANAKCPKKLLDMIYEQDAQSFLTIPFALIESVTAYNESNILAKDKIELYNRMSARRYDTMKAKIEPSISISSEKANICYIRMAMAMMIMSCQLFGKEDIIKVCNISEKQFDDLVRINMIEKYGVKYSFIHNAFKEYYAATFLTKIIQLSEVKEIVCYEKTNEIMPEWYNTILLWIILMAKSNNGTISQDIVDWLKDNDQALLTHSDITFFDDNTRFLVIKSIIEENKSQNTYLHVYDNGNYKYLMKFGNVRQTYEYIADEISKCNGNSRHLNNLMCLLSLSKWNSIPNNIREQLENIVQERLCMVDSEDGYWVCNILMDDYFVAKNNTYFNLLKDYHSENAVEASFMLIYKSNTIDEHINYIIDNEKVIGSNEKKLNNRDIVYKLFGKAKQSSSIISILKHISGRKYSNKHSNDSRLHETEIKLIESLQSAAINAEEIDAIKNICKYRCKGILFWVNDKERNILNSYKDFFVTTNTFNGDIKVLLDHMLNDRILTEEILSEERKQRQQWFDDMCDYEKFKKSAHSIVDEVRQGKDLYEINTTGSFYEYNFLRRQFSFNESPKLELIDSIIDNRKNHSNYAMTEISKVLCGDKTNLAVAEEQKYFCMERAHAILMEYERTNTLNPCNMVADTAFYAAINLVILKKISLKDSTLKSLISFSNHHVHTYYGENGYQYSEGTLLDIMKEQLKENELQECVLTEMKKCIGNCNEMLFLDLASFSVANNYNDCIEIVIDLIHHSERTDFVNMLIDIMQQDYLEELYNMYDELANEKIKTHLLLKFAECQYRLFYVINELEARLAAIKDEYQKYKVLEVLCDNGSPFALEYLVEHPEYIEHIGWNKFKYTQVEAVDSLLDLYEFTIKESAKRIIASNPIINCLWKIMNGNKDVHDKIIEKLVLMKKKYSSSIVAIGDVIKSCDKYFLTKSQPLYCLEDTISIIDLYI